MAVYVDSMFAAFGRMKMSHMLADSTPELLEMAHRIGVATRWLQHAGTTKEHFDVCKSRRALAVAAGAQEVTARELVEIIRRKRVE